MNKSTYRPVVLLSSQIINTFSVVATSKFNFLLWLSVNTFQTYLAYSYYRLECSPDPASSMLASSMRAKRSGYMMAITAITYNFLYIYCLIQRTRSITPYPQSTVHNRKWTVVNINKWHLLHSRPNPKPSENSTQFVKLSILSTVTSRSWQNIQI